MGTDNEIKEHTEQQQKDKLFTQIVFFIDAVWWSWLLVAFIVVVFLLNRFGCCPLFIFVFISHLFVYIFSLDSIAVGVMWIGYMELLCFYLLFKFDRQIRIVNARLFAFSYMGMSMDICLWISNWILLFSIFQCCWFILLFFWGLLSHSSARHPTSTAERYWFLSYILPFFIAIVFLYNRFTIDLYEKQLMYSLQLSLMILLQKYWMLLNASLPKQYPSICKTK